MVDADIAFLEQKLKRLEGVVQDISSCTNSGQQGVGPEGRMDTSFSDPLWSTLPDLGRIDSILSFPLDHRGSVDTTSSDNSNEDVLETVGSRDHNSAVRGGNDAYSSDKDKAIRRRVYDVLRTFDGYVTCSLGLPRSLRGLGHVGTSIDAPYLGQPEMLLAANANLDLLDILGDTRETLYMAKAGTRAGSPSVVGTRQLQEFECALDRWVQKYPAFGQITDDELSSCSKQAATPIPSVASLHPLTSIVQTPTLPQILPLLRQLGDVSPIRTPRRTATRGAQPFRPRLRIKMRGSCHQCCLDRTRAGQSGDVR